MMTGHSVITSMMPYDSLNLTKPSHSGILLGRMLSFEQRLADSPNTSGQLAFATAL